MTIMAIVAKWYNMDAMRNEVHYNLIFTHMCVYITNMQVHESMY